MDILVSVIYALIYLACIVLAYYLINLGAGVARHLDSSDGHEGNHANLSTGCRPGLAQSIRASRSPTGAVAT